MGERVVLCRRDELASGEARRFDVGEHRIALVRIDGGFYASAAGHEVVRGVDLTVRSGEVHVVMGPNGSGKSTLAHALMGRPGTTVSQGSVRLDGLELVGMPSWRRARA